MSIIAQTQFMKDLETKLKDELTYSVMEAVMNNVRNVLSNYELNVVSIQETGKDVMLDAYLDALSVEGKSDKTIKHYRYELQRFFQHAGVSAQNITQYHIRNYLANDKDRGLADTTIQGHYFILSSYFNWLHRDGILQRNPMGNIHGVKVQKKVKEVFSDIDIEKLKDNSGSLRNKAIIYFLRSTCCRIGEVVQLNRTDIDFTKLECVVLGKGNKQRVVYLDDVTGMVLKEYLDSRKDNDPCLFRGIRGRITSGGIRTMLQVVAKRAGVSHCHPHKFRRSKITDLVAKGMPLELVKQLAGHDKIETTMKYVVINQDNVKTSFRKFA